MPNEIEDLDLKLKLALIFSHFGFFASLIIVGGLQTLTIVAGFQFGWWLTPLGVVPLALLLWSVSLREKARYLLGWDEEDDAT